VGHPRAPGDLGGVAALAGGGRGDRGKVQLRQVLEQGAGGLQLDVGQVEGGELAPVKVKV
jgi:hypothetical protein